MRLRQPMVLPSHKVLSQLAYDDPQAFEALRSELIENHINGASETERPRLRGIQFRVDGLRRLSRSPFGALLKIQAMMWESFLRMDRELQSYVHLDASLSGPDNNEIQVLAGSNRNALVLDLKNYLPARSR